MAKTIYETRFGPLVDEAIVGVVKDEINLLRALHSLPARTDKEVKTAIVTKYNSLEE